jgi:hypothetical protein
MTVPFSGNRDVVIDLAMDVALNCAAQRRR